MPRKIATRARIAVALALALLIAIVALLFFRFNREDEAARGQGPPIGKPFRPEDIGRKVAQVLQADRPDAEDGNVVRFPDGRG